LVYDAAVRPTLSIVAALLLACTPLPGPETAAPAVPVEPRGGDDQDATAEAEAEPAPTPTAEDDGGDAHDHGVLTADLNGRYAQETDVAQWRDRFERPSREVHDKRAQIVAAIGLRRGEHVADIGAGTGLYTFEFAKAVGKSGGVVAVDVQDYFLEYLGEQAKSRGLRNVTTVKASQRSVGLPPDSVDVAFLCDAYHHIEHPAPYLASVLAALKPGGRLVIVDYAKVDGAKPFIAEHVRDTPTAFRREIEAAGFRFVRAEEFLHENFMFVFERP
jgi:SAM-dependent methyltransferase